MIQLNILTKNKQVSELIGKFLIDQKYAIAVQIIGDISVIDQNKNVVNLSRIILVTRHLLYSKLEDKLRALFENEIFEFYAVPIVEMDWEQAERINKEIEITN